MKRDYKYAAALIGLVGLGAAVFAQIEGGDRGIPPIDSSGSFEVSGVAVDVAGRTAEEARYGGWRIAQRKGWQTLWAKTHGANSLAPALSDSALDAIVAGIVVEDEQIGPARYVARLGVLFDRARTGQLLGVGGQAQRSAPLLVIPVLWSGGTPTTFETRNEWQRAWARFRSGNSPIDYVRVAGTGADPTLLNFGQTIRPGRIWWRGLLDQYGAADVVVPQVRLQRFFPGGPVIGTFTARHGPDNKLLGGFTLRVATSEALPAMLDEGVRRIDKLYADALAMGLLQPDPSLIIEQPVPVEATPTTDEAVTSDDEPVDEGTEVAAPTPATTSVTILFATPDSAAVTATESAVRGTAGVSSATTTSLAIGGTSVMRVSFAGDVSALRSALQARGFQVQDEGGSLRIAR